MKTIYLLIGLFIAGMCFQAKAQVDPGTANLKHQWTFESDANDVVGGVTAYTNGMAEVIDGALTLAGGYLDIDAYALEINSNTELTFSAWYTSTTGANTGFHFLFYFGDTFNGVGEGGVNFTGFTPIRGVQADFSRAMYDVGTGEKGVNGIEYLTDGLHHVAYTLGNSEIKLYIDGVLQQVTSAPADVVQKLSNTNAWIGRGGWYTWDPNWQGTIDDFRIYDKVLTEDNIKFLYNEHAAPITPNAPSSVNLKHQWTYDDGTATDLIGGLTTTLQEGAKLSNQALDLTEGGYADIATDGLEIGNYFEGVSVEMWFTSGVNTDYHMPFYFGATSNVVSDGGGDLCLAYTANRGGENRGSIFMKSGNTEIAVPSYPINDSKLRHVVAVVNNSDRTLSFYMDGLLVGTKTNDIFTTSNISNQLAWFGRGGWTNQPRWKGLIHKVNIYDTPLTIENVKYLNAQGAESNPLILTSTKGIGVSANFLSTTFTVSGVGLTGPITITTPSGITVDPTTLPKDANQAIVTVTYDGTTAVDGNITLTSGTSVKNVLIKATTTNCFTPLYPDLTNLIPDPECNSISNFIGWGARRVVNNVAEPDNVFCGPNAIEVGDGVGRFAGSIDVSLKDKLKPNRTYRVRAMVKTIGGENRITIRNAGTAEGLDVERTIDTNGEWMPLDFTFTSGASFPEDPLTFFNHHDLNTGFGYIDNWEMYDISDLTSVEKELATTVSLYVRNQELIISGNDISEVNIYNVSGSLIKKSNEKIINISSITAGVYIADITSEGIPVKIKFIVQ